MKKWYVYELVNLIGTIEYVGETINPKIRFYDHVKRSRGKFYGRNDISMNIAKEFDNRKEAYDYQCNLQSKYGLLTDNQKLAKNASKGWIGSEKQFMRIRNAQKKSKIWYNSELQSIKGKKAFVKQNIELICPHCKKVGVGRIMYRWHFDNCKNKNSID